MIFLFLEMLALGFSSELYCEGPPPKLRSKKTLPGALLRQRGERELGVVCSQQSYQRLNYDGNNVYSTTSYTK